MDRVSRALQGERAWHAFGWLCVLQHLWAMDEKLCKMLVCAATIYWIIAGSQPQRPREA
jgi:hypothetical protein